MPTTNCLLVADQVNDLATSLIAQLIGANYQVIMLVDDEHAPAYANPLSGLHLYKATGPSKQAVEAQIADLHAVYGEIQHMLFCCSAGDKRVSGKDMERGRFWTACFSSYHERMAGNGSMVLLHKRANQHHSRARANLLPGLSRWWAKQHSVTGVRCNSLCLQGYNQGQLHAQTGRLIQRLLEQQLNGCHYQVKKGEVNLMSAAVTSSHGLSLL